MADESTRTRLEPIEKTLDVKWDPTTAFRRFTEEISRWWPLATHAVDPERVERCAVESGAGGRIYETWDDGSEHLWGTIIVWDPPGRLAFTWHPGRDPDTAQEIEVTFEERNEGCRLRLVHEGWERLGPKAAETRSRYGPGWDRVLGRYAEE